MEKVTKVEWTDTAKTALKNVFDFHAKYSEQSAKNIVNDIIDTADTIVFAHQYQVDDINPNYRRMVVRDYKILYKISQKVVLIMNIVSTKVNPEKLKKL
ncbi:MAG: type II toxin-antitoxin system RelE/ParE family toxin [Vicingaceae bacterium]|nr:type II toxin-antitoxin system RelE/ParE family toxin [Vicingaceae bacterium]